MFVHIKKMRVKNFRSLENVSISFKPGLNVLVGKNNAGKSNVIRALDYVLGETWPTFRNIEQKDFFKKNQTEPPSDSFFIAVELSVGSLNRKIVESVQRKVRVLKLRAPPLWDDISYFLDVFPTLDDGSWESYLQLCDRLSDSESLIIFLAVPREGGKKERTYGLVFKQKGVWYGVLSFAGELRDTLMTTAYIPSFRDPNNQLRINQYTWYGKIIRHLYGQKNMVQEKAIRDARGKQTEVLREIFQDATEHLRQSLKESVFYHDIAFLPGSDTPDDEHKQITLFVNDGLNTPFYEKGSGIQSALIISLFSYYCRCFHQGSSLLLVEEPEIYLHPQARRAIEARLVDFAEEISGEIADMIEHQVIVSTHSSEFLRSVPLSQVSLIQRSGNDVRTRIVQTSLSLPKAQQVLQTKGVELVFADHVLLVEGGEEYIIPVLADLNFGKRNWLDTHNISIVRVNGKGSFETYIQILKELGISWTLLTDFDFLVDEVSKFRNYFDDSSWDKIEKVRLEIRKITTIPKGNRVKEILAPTTRDWVSLYNLVRKSIDDITTGIKLTDSELDEIRNIWSGLADRIVKPNFESFLSDSSKMEMLGHALRELREHGFFVLSRGELEDYFSNESNQLSNSKDRRALEIGSKLLECKNIDEVKRWIEPSEFIEILKALEKHAF
jgi:energy-coupling factor transporter ATP-binding protein EcfA2